MPRSRTQAVLLGVIALATVAIACNSWRAAEQRSEPIPLTTIAAADPMDDSQILPSQETAGTGNEQPHADFRGSWKLDLKASDTLDPILEAHGRSSLERSIARNVSVTHVITENRGEIEIEIKTALFSKKENAIPNGEPRTSTDESGKEVQVVDRWSEDGQTLITEGSTNLPEGLAKMTFRRSLADAGKTMSLLIDYEMPDGKKISIRRIFRRVE